MGFIISVYTKLAFKEFILPSINNSDYEITLRNNYFQLQEDIQLKLEVLDGVWRIKKSLKYSGIVQEGQVLEDNTIISLMTGHGEEISIIPKHNTSNFHEYKKFSLKDVSMITIGNETNNTICYNYLRMVSRCHAKIVKCDSGFQIENNSANGLYVNSMKVEGSTELEFGSLINILGLHMVYLGDILAIDMMENGVSVDERILRPCELQLEETVLLDSQQRLPAVAKMYHRAPRNYEKLYSEVIEIEAPPQKREEKKEPLILTLGPSITMVIPMLLGYAFMGYASKMSGEGSNLMMYSGVIMMLGSGIFSVIWALLSLKQRKKDEKEENALRFQSYSQYLLEKKQEVEAIYEDTIRKLEETYPSADACLNYNENKGVLWNRNHTHDDFLRHRLGIGELPFQSNIVIPKKSFSLRKDDLKEQPQKIKDNFKLLYNVPITLDLMQRKIIGIVGRSNKQNAIDIARLLSVQIAANNCYTDVKLAYIYDNETSDDNGQWDFARWFPHTWSEDKSTRFIAASKEDMSEVLYELTRIMRSREDEEGMSFDEERIPKPYYVVFVSDVALLEGQSINKYMNSKDPKYGLTMVLLTDRHEKLPNDCEFIIENSEDFSGMYDVYESRKERQQIQFDKVDRKQLDTFARHLSSLHVPETEEGGEIPNSITFFDMYNINRIEEYPVKEMWAKCRTYENIKGMLGQRSGGVPSYLDVHEKYHGPHGLVAGTTGSGKSETLQTYILSLAINYSPDDVGFFIIDYKGGGMANLFDGLPHMIGSISNLSGNQVKRAMISIKSENRRRQRVFSENGVNNINLYTKLYKNGEAHMPVPHLFIIIDEFAELKREEPEFMKELISVAQVGRSLGVHLILATQKPSGTVDDNIWSNSKFRLCLRVQDKNDSKDMLHKEDAAFITQAGRGYLQVGNDELYELFQSGFSGAIYSEDMVVTTKDVAKMVSLPGKIIMTGNSVKQSQKMHAELLWITRLCQCMQQALSYISREETKNLPDAENKIMFLVEKMYLVMKENKIDYPVSEYNTARLKDFIRVYGEATEQATEESALPSIILNLCSCNNIKMPQAKEKTQLDVTIEYLAKVAKENGYTHNMQLWMPVLGEKIYLDEFEEYRRTAYGNGQWKRPAKAGKLEVVIGKADDPENQNQMAVTFDFIEKGHMAIMGSIVTGRSTFVQTIAYSLIQRYTPEYVNIYALDFSSKSMSAFENAPQFGGVMYEDDQEKISKFVNMLNSIMAERKQILKGGNFKQYIETNGPVLPAIVLLIDNYGTFKEKTEEAYDEFMVRVSKEGNSLGIYMVVTGQSYSFADVTGRVGENIETVYCLEYPEWFSYVEFLHTPHFDVLPENGIKGRGIAKIEEKILEYQVALALEADNDYQRIEKIEDVCLDMKEHWNGAPARGIPTIPEKPVWSEFVKLLSYEKQNQERDRIAVGYNQSSADVFSLNTKDFFCYLICGAPRTGKTNYMRVMLQSVLAKEADVCIIDGPKKELKIYKSKEHVTYLDTEEDIVQYFSNTLTPMFAQRNEKKWQLLDQECEEEEIFETMAMEERPLFIFIGDLLEFQNMVYGSDQGMDAFMENLVEKGSLHNIYFISEISVNKMSQAGAYQMFNLFASYQTGIHFGGKTEDNSKLPFGYLSYTESSRKEPVGVGMLPGESNYEGVRKIVVPMARK